MKMMKRLTALLLAACLCLALFGCNEEAPGSTTTAPGAVDTPPGGSAAPDAQPQQHTVRLTTLAGTALGGVGVYVYEDATAQELIWFAKTDASGVMTFTAPARDGYVAILEGVPSGYQLEESYPIAGLETDITLSTQLISADEAAGKKFTLGDVMWDLTVTDLNGQTHQISKLLQEKEVVMLNFWYVDCTPCRQEFPYLQQAYEANADKIALLALNCIDQDPEKIRQLVDQLGLTMPVAQCGQEVSDALSLMSYPTTIVIDRYGIISLYHVGAIEGAGAFGDVMNYFTSDAYQQTIVRDVNAIITPEDNNDEPPINNPTSVGGVTEFQLTVRPGEEVYCDVYRADQMYMTIDSPNAVLTYNGRVLKPNSKDRIAVVLYCPDTRTPTTICLGNSGTETETFTLKLQAQAGSLNNPYRMQLGEFDVSISSGEDQGVYYSYTAPADGYLIVGCLSATDGVPYGFNLYNLSSYANRNLENDYVLDEQGQAVVRIAAKKGQKIQFNPSALPNDNGSYPAIKMRFLATFHEGLDLGELDAKQIVYAVTAVGKDRQGIAGVPVVFQTEKGTQTVTTNEKGVAALKLPVGTYTATLRLPAGYTARTTELTLTEEAPTQAIKLDQVIVNIRDYTVTVTDDKGAPMENVLVTVGESVVYTDASGIAIFSLVEDSYTAVIGVPEGYTSEAISYPFPEGETSLTVVLTKGGSGSEEDGKIDYCVAVTDYYGDPITGVTVTFFQNGKVVGLQNVDAAGKAVIQLLPGNYTATLAFKSGAYHYDESKLVLSEEAPEATVVAVAKRSSKVVELYVGNAYNVNTGATYVDGMQTNVVNYFIFKPAVSGHYQVTTTDPAAVVSYWGASTAYITDQTGLVKNGDNSFSLEVREEYLNEDTVYILGITGSETAILLVERTGDIILTDEEKAEWIIYEAKEPAQKFSLKLGTGESLTYLDLKSESITYVKGADGYYHLNDANGPILYVNLGTDGRFMPFHAMLGFEQAGGTGFQRVFYEGEKFIKKEDYTACMQSFVKACVDSQGYGVYPLNDDLIYMIQNGGTAKGWYDSENPSYLFGDSADVNPEILWMFSIMYVTK